MKRSLLCVYFGFVAMNALATRAAETRRLPKGVLEDKVCRGWDG